MEATLTAESPTWANFSAPQRAILLALPEHRTLTRAADAVGIHRSTVYDWQAKDESYADAIRQAKEATADAIEYELQRRALTGSTAWDVTAGIFLLKGYRPQFRDSYNVNVNQTVTVTHQIAELDTADQLAILSLMQRRLIASSEGGEGQPIEAEFHPAGDPSE